MFFHDPQVDESTGGRVVPDLDPICISPQKKVITQLLTVCSRVLERSSTYLPQSPHAPYVLLSVSVMGEFAHTTCHLSATSQLKVEDCGNDL